MANAIDYESEAKDYAIQLDVEKGIVRKLKVVGTVGKYDAADVANEAEKMDFVPMVTTRTFANGDRLKSKGKMRSATAAETIRQRQGIAQANTDANKEARKKRESAKTRSAGLADAGLSLEPVNRVSEIVNEVTTNGQTVGQ